MLALTLSSTCTTRWVCLRRKTEPRNFSSGQQGALGKQPGAAGASGPCVNSFVTASCDSSVGMNAAHERCGNIRDGGLITAREKITGWKTKKVARTD